jgi:glycosyltransferase involved in cell wall biosynthesis
MNLEKEALIRNSIHPYYDIIFENECSDVAISMIIHVLNAEKYVRNFFKYIKSEMLIVSSNNIEFIFVDSGSQDKTLSLILKYVAEEELCGKVVYAKGADVSTSRNMGIELSTGEYIVFADIDDVPVLRGFTIASHYAKMHSVDVAFGRFVVFDEVRGRVVYGTPFKELMRISGKDLLSQIRKSHCQSFYKALDLRLQQGVYQRRFLLHEGIRFTSGAISHEDFEFLIKVLLKAHNVLIVPIPVYIYSFRPTSVKLERFFNGIRILEKVCKLLSDTDWCHVMLLQDFSSILDHYILSKLLRFKPEKEIQQFIQSNYNILLTHYYIYLRHLINFCLKEDYLSLDSVLKILRILLKYVLLRMLQAKINQSGWRG